MTMEPIRTLPEKVLPRHQERQAVVYVRQSTMRQVAQNRESTRLQYGLADRACGLGWRREQVTVIDDDLGVSGSSTQDRPGFQRLVTEVGLGHVGLVLGIEVSRLARSCRDWHQLLEMCALFDTLIGDADGIYDPGTYNDRLLLGLKGTMSEAELHILKARMHEGRCAKARRGELILGLPRGYVLKPSGEVALDPDEGVQRTIRLVFAVFERRRSVSGVLRYLTKSRPFWAKAAMLVLALSAVTLVRWYIDRGRSGAPFALYYPLVILVAVAFGGRWAVAAGALSSLLSVVLFFDPAFTLRTSIPDLVILSLYAFGCTLIAFFGHLLRATMREADENAAALNSINRELHHRSRNVATVVRALLHRARKSQPHSIQLDQFEAQLTALFAANEILKFGMAKSCDLKALAQAVLRPFPIQQIKLLGPAYDVPEQVVTRLAMILHELATNAVKYGAMSDEGGQVAITWADKNGLLQIVWQETGGPPVQQPSREGLGSYLLRPGGGLKAAKQAMTLKGLLAIWYLPPSKGSRSSRMAITSDEEFSLPRH